MTRPIRVLIADDQRVVRQGLVLVLGLLPGIEVVGAAHDGDEAATMAAHLMPDVVLMDLRMPRCDGVEATARLRQQTPGIAVVVLTTYTDEQSVIDALRAGARGFLTKDADAQEILRALTAVMRGTPAIDPAVQQRLVDAVVAQAPAPRPEPTLPGGLTPREAQVLALMADGLSNLEIARRLTVGEATVKSHINHIFTKIDVRDRVQAVRYAFHHGLAPRP